MPLGVTLTMFSCVFIFSMNMTMAYAYLPKMIKTFGSEEVEVASHTGLVISSMFFARIFSSYIWGWLSDNCGKKRMCVVSSVFLGLSTVMFGFSYNLYWAIVGRFLQGLASGVVVIARAILNELADDTNQSFCMILISTANSLGVIAGPSLGGYLVLPSDRYPNIFPRGCIFDRFGFLLPNLMLGVFFLVTAAAIICTLPGDSTSHTTIDELDSLLTPRSTFEESFEISMIECDDFIFVDTGFAGINVEPDVPISIITPPHSPTPSSSSYSKQLHDYHKERKLERCSSLNENMKGSLLYTNQLYDYGKVARTMSSTTRTVSISRSLRCPSLEDVALENPVGFATPNKDASLAEFSGAQRNRAGTIETLCSHHSIDDSVVAQVPMLCAKKVSVKRKGILQRVKGLSLVRMLTNQDFMQASLLATFYAMPTIAFVGVYSVWASSKEEFNGLEFSPLDIGMSLFIVCCFLVVAQPLLLTRIAKKLGGKWLMIICCFCLVLFQPFYPMLVKIQNKYLLWVALTSTLFICRFAVSGTGTSLNVFINNSVTPDLTGSANGLAMTMSCAGRAVSPMLFGFLQSWSMTNIKHLYPRALGFPFDQHLCFYILSLFSVVGAIWTAFIPDHLQKKKYFEKEKEDDSKDDSKEQLLPKC